MKPQIREPQIRFSVNRSEEFAEGLALGDTGPYLRLAGEVAFAVDPESPAYSMVVDIESAPRNDAGLVEYATDFYILRPVDLSRGNRRLLYDVNNRGNLRMLQYFNDAVISVTGVDILLLVELAVLDEHEVHWAVNHHGRHRHDNRRGLLTKHD